MQSLELARLVIVEAEERGHGRNLHEGDEVRWESHGGEAAGKVDVRAEFREAVNMTPGELSEWLKSGQSRSVGGTPGGQKKSSSGGSESVGHDSGA